jgi:LysR family glycine cleavage system transcriptional activator
MIGDAAARQDDRGIAGSFVVSCTPGFAAPWLCSHIGEFLDRYPEVALRVRTPRQLDETANPEVDVFIAFGDGDWPGRSVELLSEVEFTPLCSPALLNKAGGFLEPRDLLKVPLLHLSDHKDWARWLALAGVEPPDQTPGMVFSDINLVLAAASAGQGAAMGDELTCARTLASGNLVRPFELGIKSAQAYYLVTERRKAAAPVNRAFRRWLRGRIAEVAVGRAKTTR